MIANPPKPAVGNPRAVTPAREPAHLNFLDGIRGGAALWVLLAHCMIWGGWHGVPLPDPKIAVDIFMVVSGHLMFFLAEQRAVKEPPGQWSTAFKFWIRRCLRIAPLYYLVLIAAFAFGHLIADGYGTLQQANLKRWVGTQYYPVSLDDSLTSFWMHISFVFGLFPRYASSVGLPDWSIGLEMQFYAVFALLWLLFRRLRPLFATLLVLGVWYYLQRLIIYPKFPEPSFLPLKLPLFIVGMLAASANQDFQRLPLDGAVQMAIALFLASYQSSYVVVVAGLMCLLVSASPESEFLLSRVRGIVSPVLGNRLTRFMADTSYGVYLIHGFLISIVGGWLYSREYILHLRPVYRTTLLTLITLMGSYPLAWVLHRTVELRGIELGRRFIKTMGGRPAESR